MNFPDKQRIGRLAELKVDEVFTSWSWTVGKDLIDAGYDFMVEPDTTVFSGGRFLVQVKGTARSKKAGAVAPVAKRRLRQYANNRLPVFLICATAEGVLHWLHVQPWARQNMGRLSGNGNAGIKMPAQQTLDDKAKFSAYLLDLFQPAAESPTALVELAEARSDFLTAIDPNFGVQIGVRDGAQTYQIYAKTDQAQLGFEMTVGGDAANKGGLRDAITYGLPATIAVDAFRLTGSPLWSVIGADTFSKGKIDVRSTATKPSTVVLYPGRAYSLIAERYAMTTTLYIGQGGFAILVENPSELFSFELRGGFAREALGRADITMGLRRGVLGSAPIQRLDTLASLGAWAKQAIDQGGIYVEVNIPKGRIPMFASLDEKNNIVPILRYAYTLSVIHQVAKVLNSAIVVDDDVVLEKKEASNLFLAYALLRGERRPVGLTQVDFATDPIQLTSHGKFYITTAIKLTVGGRLLGVIPVALDLDNYTHIMMDTGQHRLTKDDDGSAVIYYNERGATDAQVSLTPLSLRNS